MSRPITALALAALLALAAIGSAGAGQAMVGKPVATPKGVGELRLGRTIAQLQELKLIGGAHRGCELSPGEKAAKLKAPLAGTATFFPGKRLSSIGLTGGAETATGIHVGSSVADARSAYPGAPYDKPRLRSGIAFGFVWIGGRAHPKMTLVIVPITLDVIEIAIPSPSICE